MDIIGSKDGMQGTSSISAFFTTRESANVARASLVEAGFSFEAVKITDGRGTVTGRSTAAKPVTDGFIDTLKNAFAQGQLSDEPEATRPAHQLTAHVPASMAGKAREIIARGGEIVEEA